MVSFERIQRIMGIKTERFGEGKEIENNWPAQGTIEFKNYHLKYRPETELVL